MRSKVAVLGLNPTYGPETKRVKNLLDVKYRGN